MVDSGATVNVTALFSGNELTNTSAHFEGGTLTAAFGGVTLNLVRATPAPGARLDASALFGGVEVTVPDDWRVTIDGPAIFGGFENRASVADPQAPTLKIRALAMFAASRSRRRPARPTPRVPVGGEVSVPGVAITRPRRRPCPTER